MNTRSSLAFITSREELFEIALLIGRTETQCTLRVTFDLEHLNQRLEILPRSPIRIGIRDIIDGVACKRQTP